MVYVLLKKKLSAECLLHDAEAGKNEEYTLSLACQMVVKCCL